MTDMHERIKDAVTVSVRDAEAPADLLTAVYGRYRRGRRLRAAIGAAAVMVVLAGLIALAARPRESTPPVSPHHAAIFPGGGRLLLDSTGRLRWLSSDGGVTRIPGRFSGASVFAGELLAWKYTGPRAGYYTMSLAGQRQRRVLPMAWSRRLSVIQAQLSPDRSLLAYVRQDIVSARSVTDTLWIKNLDTGRTVGAGPVSSDGFTWAGPGTLIAGARDGHSLAAISAATGARRQFLSVADPALVRAYKKVRPGAGKPAYIRTDGSPGTGWSGRLAIWLAAAEHPTGGVYPSEGTFTQPAEIIVAGVRPIAAYAPVTPAELGLTWGPGGLFALLTGAGDNPASWVTYVGAVAIRRLSAGIGYGQDGVMFSPGGTVLALNDGGQETLVPVPRPACGSRCLGFRLMVLPRAGVIQAWLR